jgi:hypothetical protein
MQVYHGSYLPIAHIDLSKCQSHKDFGKGFYVTKIRAQAEYWAQRRGLQNETEGNVTEFTFIENAFTNWKLNVLRFDGYTEQWLDFVALNRNVLSPEPAHDYDIVEGPVADDKITRRIDKYLQGEIVKMEFLKELEFQYPTHQICLCTHVSLQSLRQMEALHTDDIDTRVTAALVAEDGLDELSAIDAYFESETYRKLIDKSTNLYLQPWQEILGMLREEFELRSCQ